MALREGRCLLDRRFADRGNDISVLYSRARGEDRCPTRRVADRGSDGVYHDPRDLEEIRRLRQRVRDLEEIRWLRKRVRDLEVQQEMRVKETESESIVWDDVNEEEEHPFCHPHPWFSEPIYQQYISEDRPRFDEDGIEPDEEECSFVQKILSGIIVQDDEHKKNKDDTGRDARLEVRNKSTSFFGNLIEYLNEDKAFNGGEETPLMSTKIKEGMTVAQGMEGLHFGKFKNAEYEGPDDSRKVQPIKNMKIQIQIQIEDTCEVVDKLSKIYDYKPPNNIRSNDITSSMDDVYVESTNGIWDYLEPQKELSDRLNNRHRTNTGLGAVLWTANAQAEIGPVHGLHGPLFSPRYIHLDMAGQRVNLDPHIHLGFFAAINGNKYEVQVGANIFEQVKSLVNRRSNAPFDPGGTGLALGETTHEAKLFRRVVMIIDWNRVDVPFDPGGFGSKAKLEDEFFSKTGSMMQGYLQVY